MLSSDTFAVVHVIPDVAKDEINTLIAPGIARLERRLSCPEFRRSGGLDSGGLEDWFSFAGISTLAKELHRNQSSSEVDAEAGGDRCEGHEVFGFLTDNVSGWVAEVARQIRHQLLGDATPST